MEIGTNCYPNKFTAYFISGPGPGPGPSEKADPGPAEKADPMPKFTVWVKDSFLTKLRMLISYVTIVF